MNVRPLHLATLLAVAPACPAGVVAFSNFDPDTWNSPVSTGTGYGFNSTNPDLKNGWGFTAQSSGEVTRLAALAGARSPTPTTITMELYRSDANGLPGERLGVWTETCGDGTNGSFFQASDTAGISLVQGQEYHLVATRPDPGERGFFWRTTNTDGMPPQVSTLDGIIWDRTDDGPGTNLPVGIHITVTPAPGSVLPLSAVALFAARRRRP